MVSGASPMHFVRHGDLAGGAVRWCFPVARTVELVGGAVRKVSRIVPRRY